MVVLPDGRIVSGAYDNTLRIWNSTSAECEVVLEGHSRVSDKYNSIVNMCCWWCLLIVENNEGVFGIIDGCNAYCSIIIMVYAIISILM